MDYARLFTSSWQFTRDNKAVMVLGGLISLFAFFGQLDLLGQLWIREFYPFLRLMALCVTLFLSIALGYLSIWSKASIVQLVLFMEQNQQEHSDEIAPKETSSLALAQQMLRHTKADQPRLVKFYLISIGGSVLLLIPVFIIAFIQATKSNAIFILALVVAVPILLIAIRTWDQCIAVMVVERLTPMAAIGRSYQVLMDNLGNYIAVTIITSLLYYLLSLLIRSPLTILENFLPTGIYIFVYILWLPIWITAYSTYTGFTNVVWTQVFLQLTRSAETD